jgi:hypothetical protein
VQIPRSTRLLCRALPAALFVTLLAGLVPASPAEARTGHVPRVYFGLHDASLQSYDHLDFGSLRLWDAHVTWRELEVSPGVFNWTLLDSYVRAAQQHHTQVTLVLATTPAFYSAAPSLPPTLTSDYTRFVRAVMQRYRSFEGQRGITAYQVWNEGNVPFFWSGTPHRLALLTRAVWRIHRQVDPGATIVAPSFAVRLPSQRRWLSAYESQRVGGHPVRHFYDANALSIYPQTTYGARIGGPEDSMRLVNVVRHVLARDGVPSATPLWATEVNYGVTGQPTAATPISERRQVANVIRTYVLGAARGLARMYWYRYDWNSISPARGGGTLGNTLLSVPGSPSQMTSAGAALTTAERWLRGRLVADRGHRPCDRGRGGTYTCVVRYAGGVRRILWNPDRPVRIPFPRGAIVLQRAGEGVRAVSRRQSMLRVTFLPVMVDSRR